MKIREELMEKMEQKFKEGFKENIENYNSNLYYKFYVELENNEIIDFWWSTFTNQNEDYTNLSYICIYSISGYYISGWYDDILFNLKDLMIRENFLNCNDNEFNGNLDEVFEKFKKENEIDLTEECIDYLLEYDVFDYEFEKAFENIEII